ncbi:MAG: hypothetical protein AAF416_14130 [Pseudomonadota bacterium]
MTVATAAMVEAMSARNAEAFGFLFAEFFTDPNIVTHAPGYQGFGGQLDIDVAIDFGSSPLTSNIGISVQNVINTWNGLQPTVENLVPFGSNNLLRPGQQDFESVLLHEMGHALGLDHPNLASESGLPRADQDYTQSFVGLNGSFDLNPGADGVIGSADDLRNDDINANFFRIADNDPFDPVLGVVDSTTYSTDLSLLPAGDTFSANADRTVSAVSGYGMTEAVMQQLAFAGETQRTLGADDVAGIRYAQSGLDQIQGTVDDYFINLMLVDIVEDADIVIGFSESVSFAAAATGGAQFNFFPQSTVVTSADLLFNPNFDWFFNDVPNGAAVPVPAPLALLLGALGSFALVQRRGRRSEIALA